MITSDTMRGFNDLIVLHLLCQGDSYGYELAKRIAGLSGNAYLIKETTLYSAINRLEQKGYVRGYDGWETRGRARTYYAVTDVGRTYLAEKQKEWEEIKEVITGILEGKRNEYDRDH